MRRILILVGSAIFAISLSASAKPPVKPAPPEPAPGVCPKGGVPAANASHCVVQVGTCCFDNPSNACRAAGCDPGHCRFTKSSPPAAACRKHHTSKKTDGAED